MVYCFPSSATNPMSFMKYDFLNSPLWMLPPALPVVGFESQQGLWPCSFELGWVPPAQHGLAWKGSP